MWSSIVRFSVRHKIGNLLIAVIFVRVPFDFGSSTVNYYKSQRKSGCQSRRRVRDWFMLRGMGRVAFKRKFRFVELFLS